MAAADPTIETTAPTATAGTSRVAPPVAILPGTADEVRQCFKALADSAGLDEGYAHAAHVATIQLASAIKGVVVARARHLRRGVKGRLHLAVSMAIRGAALAFAVAADDDAAQETALDAVVEGATKAEEMDDSALDADTDAGAGEGAPAAAGGVAGSSAKEGGAPAAAGSVGGADA